MNEKLPPGYPVPESNASLVLKLDLWLKSKLNYPGCDERNLYLNLLSWKGNAFVMVYVPILIAGLMIFAPEAKI